MALGRGSVTSKTALNRGKHWAASWVCSWWFMELSFGEHSHSWAELLNWASVASVSLATKWRALQHLLLRAPVRVK